ncbi:MAG: PpiC-type peptidyl-prolyl cis-trans isomerase [Bryobacterales bacterium]|nr:PpiC-type peptidyl-prolyl cis-trans isomerase [Bryobacterales bacterium]
MRYLVTVVAGLAAFALASLADVVTIEQIICKINGDIITNVELDHDRADLEKQLRANGFTGQRLEDALKAELPNLLRNKIDNLLLTQKGKELELKVDADVNKYLADLQRQTNTADPQKFQDLVRQETGKSYEDFKADLKNNYYVQGVIREEVMRKIQFKTEEIRAYYDEHKDEFQRQERVFLREIAISTQGKQDNPAALAAAQKKAKDLVERARKGERFAELAQANSDSPTAKDGGALDPYKKGDLAANIEALVWDKERGTVTDPINIGSGLLILRVDEHHKAGLADFEEVEPEIQNRILGSRQQAALRAYLTKLRELSFLEIKPGYEDTGAAPAKDTAWSDPAQLKPETVTKEQVLDTPSRKRVLGVVPIPGTKRSGSSSSR